MSPNPTNRKPVQEEEIDLVDLLGVIIKRRCFIVWFIIGFTLVTSSLVLFREHKRSAISSVSKFTASDVLTVKDDTILASYIFLNKSDKQEEYKTFLKTLLFPTVIDVPVFEVQRGDKFAVNYLFLSPEDAKNFSSKYNGFIDELLKLKEYRGNMSELATASCDQFYNSRPVGFLKETEAFFDSARDIKNCNGYNYYASLIQAQVRYTTGAVPDSYYFSFIIDTVKDAEHAKLKSVNNDSESADIGKKAKSTINVKRVIKYSVLLFIFSGMLAFTLAFVLEFWGKNKKRLSTYWR